MANSQTNLTELIRTATFVKILPAGLLEPTTSAVTEYLTLSEHMQQELSHRSDNVKNRLMMRPPWVTETIEMQSDPHSPAFLPTLGHLSGMSILYLQQLHFSLNNYAHHTLSCGQKANF